MAMFNLYLSHREIRDPRVFIPVESHKTVTEWIPSTLGEYTKLFEMAVGIMVDDEMRKHIKVGALAQQNYKWGDFEKCVDAITSRKHIYHSASSFRVLISTDKKNRTVTYDEVTRKYTVKLETAEEMLQFMLNYNIRPTWDGGLTDN